MKKLLVVLLLVAFVSAGCTGSFNLTRKVYNWHRSQDDKWADEIGFLVCVFVPIYGISTFADAVVFNSIEFWTGKNPVEMSRAETGTKYVREGKAEAEIKYNANDQSVTISSNTGNTDIPNLTLKRDDNTVLARDQKGNILYAAARDANGGVSVYDKDLNLVKSYSPEEVQIMGDKYLK